MLDLSDKEILAYVIGIALGDGNLSNPNGRAVRLRVTCDVAYPELIQKIKRNIKAVAPHNKVSIVERNDSCLDISCYSNGWEDVLGWNADDGPKKIQKPTVPDWIKKHKNYSAKCLCGLIQADGCIYNDRGYTMINFTSSIMGLAKDVQEMIVNQGYCAYKRLVKEEGRKKYVVRVSKEAERMISDLSITKQ